jgi:hypothetical protein
MIRVKKQGYKPFLDMSGHDDGTAGRNYAIIESDRQLTKEQVENVLEVNGWMLGSYSSGPGRHFQDSVWIRIYGKKAIVTQRSGVDC